MKSVPLRAHIMSERSLPPATRCSGASEVKREMERDWSWFSRKTVVQASGERRRRDCVVATARLNCGRV